MRTQIIRSITEMDTLENAWQALEKTNPGPSIFQSWLWNRMWCAQVLEPNGGLDLEIRLVEDGCGRLLGIIPLFARRACGPALRIVEFLGHRMSPYNDALLSEPGNPDLARCVVAALLDSRDGRSIFHLKNLDGESEFTRALAAKGLLESQCDRVWVGADPGNMDPFGLLSRKRRKTLRHARNCLQRAGKVEFRIVPTEEFPLAFDEMIGLHQSRFSSKRASTFLTGRSLDFLKSIGIAYSKLGKTEIIQLKLDGSTIASQLNFVDRSRLFAYQSGFDPQFSKYSPIWLVEIESMRHSFSDLGCSIYDFGTCYADYKLSWNPATSKNYFSCHGGSNIYTELATGIFRFAFKRNISRIQANKTGD